MNWNDGNRARITAVKHYEKGEVLMKKKIPWGLFAGLCGVLVFYLTVASVAVFIILDRIEKETNGHANFFGSWYQILIFVLDIIFVAGTVVFSMLSVRNRRLRQLSSAAEINEMGGNSGEQSVENT